MQPEYFRYLFLFGMPLIVVSLFCFDRVVRWEHTHRHADWQKDGSPAGFFWRPKDATFWRSGAAMRTKSFVWLFVTPVWVSEMNKEKKFFYVFRGCVYAWNAAFVLFIVSLRRW